MAARRSRNGAIRSHEGRVEAALPVIGMVSLGCAKNTVDSERVLGMLADRGFPVTPDPELADVVLVNTCAFIAPAREETEEMLRSLAQEFGRSKPVVAIGCYAERLMNHHVGTEGTEGAEASVRRLGTGEDRISSAFVCDSFSGVAAFVPFVAYDELPALCRGLAAPREGRPPCPPCLRGGASSFDEAPRLRIGSPATAYLKIAEGCSNRCTYCAVPDIRGDLRSFPVEKLVAEAEDLAALGAREICVIAQDTASYGSDLYGRPGLADFLRKLCGVKGLSRVRLLYVHPARLGDPGGDDVLDVMAGEEKLVRYLDLPCQHASTSVLRAMGRRHDGAYLRRLVARVRERVPGVALRTSIIVGFPGEGDEEFRELLDFVRETEFDHLGAFCYSPEERTAAARLEKRVPARTARARRSRLMRVQQRIAFARLDSRVGSTETAMLELPAQTSASSAEPREGATSGGRTGRRRARRWLARTEREAPEVDGQVLVEEPARRGRASGPHDSSPGGRHLTSGRGTWRPGDLVEVRITARAGYDLEARRHGGKATTDERSSSSRPPTGRH